MADCPSSWHVPHARDHAALSGTYGRSQTRPRGGGCARKTARIPGRLSTIAVMRSGLAVVLALAAAAHAGPTVIHVDDDAPPGGDGATWATAFTYLQDALAAADAAGTPVELRIGQGSYRPPNCKRPDCPTADRCVPSPNRRATARRRFVSKSVPSTPSARCRGSSAAEPARGPGVVPWGPSQVPEPPQRWSDWAGRRWAPRQR